MTKENITSAASWAEENNTAENRQKAYDGAVAANKMADDLGVDKQAVASGAWSGIKKGASALWGSVTITTGKDAKDQQS